MPYFEDDNRSSRNGRGGRSVSRDHRGPISGNPNRSSNPDRLRQAPNTNQRRYRDRPYKSSRNYRTIMGADTGLSLGNRRRRRSLIRGIDDRYVIGAAAIVLLVLALLIGGCVRGCAKRSQTQDQPAAVNSIDERVAAGVSDNITTQFTTVLDRDEKLASIAKNADKYTDERLLELAIREPEAIDFVAAVPGAEKEAKPFGEGNERGSYPLVYDWDTRWGFVEYGNGNIGVNGSGPTSLFIAYAGLTGNVDKTPADLAADATAGSFTDEVMGTTADFFASEAETLGLDLSEVEPTSSNLSTSLYAGSVAIVQLQANYTSPYAHWAIAVFQSADGSVTLYDPTSAIASSHFWTAESVASHSDKMFVLSYSGPNDQDAKSDTTSQASAADAPSNDGQAKKA